LNGNVLLLEALIHIVAPRICTLCYCAKFNNHPRAILFTV